MTNGNVFFRIPHGGAGSPNFEVRRRRVQPEHRTFTDLKEYRDHYWPDGAGGYEPDGAGGYEKENTLVDPLEHPLFKSFDTITGAGTRDSGRPW